MIMRKRSGTRGFTLVEMIVTTVILAAIMSIAAMEFQSVIYQRMFLESHLTAEQQARVAMAKVSGAARQMSVDITDYQNPPPPVVQPTATPGPVLEFTQVSSLQPGELPTPGGVPQPCYDNITIQVVKTSQTVGNLEETVSPVSGPCVPAPPQAPIVLARNIAAFEVTPVAGGPSNGYGEGFQIDLTVYDQEDNTIDQRMGASYHLATVITPLIFGKAQ